MDEISVSGSGIEHFLQDMKRTYSPLLGYAEEIRKDALNCFSFVSEEEKQLKKQQLDLSKISDETDLRYRSYYRSFKDAENNYDRYHDLHWNTSDTALSKYYYDKMNEAKEEKTQYCEKCKDINDIRGKIRGKQQYLDKLASAISTIKDALQKDIYTINKCINILQDETIYNINALKTLSDCVRAYLSSKAILNHAYQGLPEYTSNYAGAVTASRKSDYKSHKYKVNIAETIGEYLSEHHAQSLTYRYFNPEMVPVKQQILQATKWMGNSFQQFILHELERVVFLNGPLNFSYERQEREGNILRIIGTDINSPDFSRVLFYHLAHHIYTTECKREKVFIEHTVAREAHIASSKADSEIQRFTAKLLSSVHTSRRKKVIPKTSGSEFFASCFNAYVNKNHTFLKAVSAVYPDSYRSFSEIIEKFTQER